MSYTSLNINLADLTAIKINCTQCHASAEFPVARLQGHSPERCFYCRAEWFDGKSPQATALEHLCRALGELRGLRSFGEVFPRREIAGRPAESPQDHRLAAVQL